MKKSKLLNLLILTALTAPGLAMAAEAETTEHKEGKHVTPETAHHTLTSNVSLVSNYLYRGISQTGAKPAIQGGFDYARSSGFYAGVWGSNISWLSDAYTETTGTAGANNASVELDTYLGFRSAFATDFSYDIGYLRYNYPGTYAPGSTKADTDEIYGAIGWNILTAKYSYSLGDTFGNANSKGSNYAELNASYSLADTGVVLGAHYGKQTFKGTGNDIYTYSDYKVSVSKDFSGHVVGLAYSSTDTEKGAGEAYHYLGKDLGKGTAVLSLARSF